MFVYVDEHYTADHNRYMDLHNHQNEADVKIKQTFEAIMANGGIQILSFDELMRSDFGYGAEKHTVHQFHNRLVSNLDSASAVDFYAILAERYRDLAKLIRLIDRNMEDSNLTVQEYLLEAIKPL